MIYDISFPLSPETMVYPGDPPFCREVLLDGAKGDDCTLSLLHLGSHLGTHIDFPRHFFPKAFDGIHPLPHPVYLTAEAGEYLAERKIALLGVDYESPEGDGDFPIHKTLLGQNIPILENLKLKDVPAGEYRLYCLPLRITEGDGCWVRPILER